MVEYTADRDPELLRALVERRIDVGHELEVVSGDVVRADGVEVALPEGAGASVWLTR